MQISVKTAFGKHFGLILKVDNFSPTQNLSIEMGLNREDVLRPQVKL